MKMDQKDIQIIEILKSNARLTIKEIAKKVKLPITTVHNRIKKLELNSIIKNFTINLNYQELGKPLLALILVTVNYNVVTGHKIDQAEIARKIKHLEGTEEVSIVTGDTDIILKVRMSSVDELNKYITEKLRNIEGIDKTKTMLVLNNF